MKIAMPIFRDRLSPVFDWSTRLLVIEILEGREVSRVETAFTDDSPTRRADRLAELEAEVLVCGGISEFMFRLVEARGIRLVPWVAGHAEEVLAAFLSGSIPCRKFSMPGCSGKLHARRRKGRGRHGPMGKQGPGS